MLQALQFTKDALLVQGFQVWVKHILILSSGHCDSGYLSVLDTISIFSFYIH